jgi:hypothetical protein
MAMVNWVLRGVILLWAAFFALLALRGIMNPMVFQETFGISIDGVAANTVRADLGSFFLVAAGGAALGILVPGWTRALLVPAALYGVALIARLIGFASGDPLSGAISQAMIIEAMTVALMVGGWWILSRPKISPDADMNDVTPQ